MSDHSGEQPVVLDDNYHYGNSEVFPARQLSLQDGDVVTDQVTISRSFHPWPGAYESILENLGSNMAILEGDEIEGVPTTLGIAIAGHHPEVSKEYTGQPGTGSSSFWNNKLQVAEHALRASQSLINFIYFDPAGQGGSSNWPPEEAAYIKKTGRYVTPEGEALPSIVEKQRLLDAAGFAVTRFTTDADGASIATAHAVAMEPGQLAHVHFNSPPIADGQGLLAAGLAELVNQIDDFRSGRASEDPARLTDEMIEMAQAALPERPGRIPAQYTKLQQARTTHTPDQLSMVAAGLARRRDTDVHPAVLDTAEMLKVHPEAKVLLQVVRRAMSEGELRSFMQDLARQNQQTSNVSAVYIPGTRRMHKAYPTVRESIRNFSFLSF